MQLALFDLLDARPVLPRPVITPSPAKLEPCPFCTSDRIEWSKTKDTIYVYCDGCGAEMHGISPKARHYVTLRWNTRGAPTALIPRRVREEAFTGFVQHDIKRLLN